MNEDAFARRFYADRAELESLGIALRGRQAGRGLPRVRALRAAAGELLPAGDRVHRLRARRAGYRAEPARRPVRLRRAAAARAAAGLLGPPEPAQRAATRPRSTIGDRPPRPAAASSPSAWPRSRPRSPPQDDQFSYYTMERDATGDRKVDPYHLLFRGGPVLFDRLLARARRRPRLPALADPGQGHLRDQGRARLHAARGLRPARLRHPRRLAVRRRPAARRRSAVSERVAWLVERDFGRYGEIRARARRRRPARARSSRPTYASSRQLVAWALGWREHATCSSRTSSPTRPTSASRCSRSATRRASRSRRPSPAAAAEAPSARTRSNGRAETAIRPERFARLVTLAGILIGAARTGERLPVADVCERARAHRGGAARGHRRAQRRQLRRRHLRALRGDRRRRTIEVDPEPYGDNFARPARLLPLEAKALIAAIDLLRRPPARRPALAERAREDRRRARRTTRSEQGLQIADAGARRLRDRARRLEAIEGRKLLKINYYKENEDEFTERDVEPYRW